MEELILKDRRFKEDIINVVNNSGLPAFMIKPFFKELLEQLETLEQKQYEEAIRIKQKEEQEKQDTKEENKKEEEE